jgi:hypothetical protein
MKRASREFLIAATVASLSAFSIPAVADQPGQGGGGEGAPKEKSSPTTRADLPTKGGGGERRPSASDGGVMFVADLPDKKGGGEAKPKPNRDPAAAKKSEKKSAAKKAPKADSSKKDAK